MIEEPNATKPMVLRDAGLMEKYYIARHYLGMFSCVVVSAKYVGTRSVLDKPVLFSALEKVVHRHPALCVRLSGEAIDRPVYVHLNEVDLSQIVEFSDETDLQDVLEAQIIRRFDTDLLLPLWRLQVLPDNTVIFAWHHGIGDGQSGLAFHRSLLAALSEIDEPTVTDPPIVSVSNDVVLVPPVEQLADLSVSWLTLIRGMYHKLAPASWSPKYSAWTGHTIPTVDTLPAAVRLLQYTPSEMARMLSLCRTHQSSLTAVMHTLSTIIVSELLEADPATAGKYTCLATSIPVSLRRVTKTPAEELCDEVSTYASFPPLITLPSGHSSWLGEFPWTVAKELTTTLQKQQREAAEHTGMVKYLYGNYQGYFKGLLGKKRTYALQISNLGRWPFNPPAAGTQQTRVWSIADLTFAQGLSASGAAIGLNATGTPAGGLGISVSWGRQSIDESLGEAFFRAFREAMDEMLTGSISAPK